MGGFVCSVITVNAKPGELRRYFARLSDPESVDVRGIDRRAHGYLKKEAAPVILLGSEGRPQVSQKYFSLCPSWSKSWPFEFETYNARLSRPKMVRDSAGRKNRALTTADGQIIEEYIYSVPSFRDAFNAGQTCLVPLSGAVESCYFGESAGHIVRFAPQNDSLLFVLGLWNDWVNPESGEIFPTFTLLTDAPDEFVFRHGHDRGVIIIQSSDWQDWLGQRPMTGKERLQFIREKRIQPAWRTEIERALKTGWVRRAPNQSEISGMRVWRP